MATRKSSSKRQKNSAARIAQSGNGRHAPGGAPAQLPNDPQAIRKLAELGVEAGRLLELRVKEEAANRERAAELKKGKSYRPSQATIEQVSGRLYDVGAALLAIHNTIPDVQIEMDADYGALTLFRETCRSAFIAVDACIEALHGAPAMGNFRDPLASR